MGRRADFWGQKSCKISAEKGKHNFTLHIDNDLFKKTQNYP